ncbi:predicted protein [Chaetoceros tenuissimus]|uniref:Uncharacterized protein n=1 Tax=Chaetoceros tenuissimus TaxID=426638 RepID=A0AAD3D728_9STRA|nr:predicted protein [Chaetoceros tenuissimus]
MQSKNDLKQRIVKAMSLVQEAGDHAAVLQTQNLMEPKSAEENIFVHHKLEKIATGVAGVKRDLDILEAIMIESRSGVKNTNFKGGDEEQEQEHSETSEGNQNANFLFHGFDARSSNLKRRHHFGEESDLFQCTVELFEILKEEKNDTSEGNQNANVSFHRFDAKNTNVKGGVEDEEQKQSDTSEGN